MKASFVLTLLSFFVALQLIGAQSGSAECAKRRDTCDDLVKEPNGSGEKGVKSTTVGTTVVTTPAPNGCVLVCTTSTGSPDSFEDDGHSHCELIEALHNISDTCLSGQEQVDFDAFILEIEETILLDFSLTDEQKVVLCAYALKNFSLTHSDIWEKISFQQIGSWGYAIDFVYVAYEIELEMTQSVVTLNGNGDCELFDAIDNATSGNSQMQTACNGLIAQMLVILEDSAWSYQQQLAQIDLLFEAFFSAHPQWKSFLLSIQIGNYGSLEMFLDVCHIYEETTTLSTVIGGNSSSCVLLQALQAAYSNTSLTISVRSQILQLYNVLLAYFNNQTDITLRLAYVSAQCYQLFKLEPFLVQILDEIQLGSWGTIYDLLFCSHVCHTYGCGCVDCGPGTTMTPEVPADCGSVSSLIVVSSMNTTIITDTLTVAYNSWNSSTRLGFNSCFNQVRQEIWNNTAYPTSSSKLTAIAKSFEAYNANNAWKQQVLMNLTITIWEGTIGQFCSCIG